KERDIRLRRWEAQLHPIRGATASALFAEAGEHAKSWDYITWADALRGRPILLVAADDQNHAEMAALADALRKTNAVALNYLTVATDHSFSDHRIALQVVVLEWLKKLQ